MEWGRGREDGRGQRGQGRRGGEGGRERNKHRVPLRDGMVKTFEKKNIAVVYTNNHVHEHQRV